MNLSGKCRTCGRQTYTIRGKTTWTRRGGDRVLRRLGYAPVMPTQPSEMTWQGAEVLARDWMKQNGFRDATLTAAGADGGVDVISTKAFAQVKHHATPVGLAEMQRLYGIAQSTGKLPLFFSSAGFTPKAIGWADTHNIACFAMPPVRGLNPAGHRVLRGRAIVGSGRRKRRT
jgi:hypothetical protein